MHHSNDHKKMDLLISDIKQQMLDMFTSQLDNAANEVANQVANQAAARPKGGGVISREKVERVWDILPDSEGFAMSANEIVSMTRLTLSVTQRVLYILLAEGRVKRRPRDMGRMGKTTYEYWKLNIPSLELPADPRQFDMEKLRAAIPKKKSEAMTVKELANRMKGNPITVRQKIGLLVAANEVIATNGVNERLQPTMRFYRARLKRSG